jgi:dipeptidyl-peptidase-4
MRVLISLLLATATLPALAERLTIDRINADPALSGASVRGLKIAPDGERVSFLRGRDDDRFQTDLWEYNLKDKAARRLVGSKALQPTEQLSDAEKARRERSRTAGFHGINSYSWSPDGKQLLIPLGGNLYLVDAARPDKPRKVATGDVLDAKISPKGKYVSFVRNQNLFVIDLASGAERQLTTDGGGTVHNAEAEFVAQEEMHQQSGYWWAPDDSAIAYKRFDEAPVALVKRFEIQATTANIIEQRYPAAGQANVTVGLAIVSPSGGASRAVDLGAEKDIYLVRADWSSDAKQLLFQRQARDQKKLELVSVDAATLHQQVLVTETSSTWVAVLAEPRFLKKQNAFIWESERSGRRHLYLYDLTGKLLHPITQGNWGIDGLLAVDEAAGRVYVASNRDAVIDKQVYALALDGSTADKPARVTKADGWHDAIFSDKAEAYVDTFSDPNTPPQVSLHKRDGSFLAWIEHNELNASHPYAKYRDAHVPTEFGTLKAADGQTLYYSLRKPLGFEPGRRYPVFISVYGGPGAQTVERNWNRSLFEQYMAQHGYVVFKLDNRGSARRERAFTDVIYRTLGQHEVADQLAGIDWLAKQPFVDGKRIGVFGWSYGGFMTLRLLAAGSDRIAAGAAVAPVTDWALYDTHYTEQFIDRPQDNAQGYTQSGVFAHLDGLRSPLLLVHGMADDNVLFTNSTSLMAELQNRGKPFELMTYPGGKHGISGAASQKHVFHTIENFLNRNLADKSAVVAGSTHGGTGE